MLILIPKTLWPFVVDTKNRFDTIQYSGTRLSGSIKDFSKVLEQLH